MSVFSKISSKISTRKRKEERSALGRRNSGETRKALVAFSDFYDFVSFVVSFVCKDKDSFCSQVSFDFVKSSCQCV